MTQWPQETHHIGKRLNFDGLLCTVRYIGEVAGAQGTWLGIEWDDPSRGKHAGEHKGVRYFNCLSNGILSASFVRPNRPSAPPFTFIEALRAKYRLWDEEMQQESAIVWVSNKVVQEYGYDKISRRQAKLEEQRLVILDGSLVTITRSEGGDGWNGDSRAEVEKICPAIVDLDLSRNLLEELEGLIEVCCGLKNLKTLKLSGNRFRTLLPDSLDPAETQRAFGNVTELGLEETLLPWQDLCGVAKNFPSLTILNAGTNQFSRLPSLELGTLASTVTLINLEFNEFKALSGLASLSGFTALRSLILKGNIIDSIVVEGEESRPVLSNTLHYVDLSYNRVSSWSFIDALPLVFPGLTGLRLSHNPIYDNPEGLGGDSRGGGGMGSTDEAFMITVGRLASLTNLNQGPVSASDRSNAEMFYLSRIARQLATTPESAESEILSSHPRYRELCDIYGAPDVVRRIEFNPEFLEARLVNVMFRSAATGEASGSEYQERTAAIPKSFDIYAVRAIAARLFGMSPLRTKLVWETGEWDPVGRLDEEDEEDSDGDSDAQNKEALRLSEEGESAPPEKSAKWVRREVELREGPRQLGFCVDGLEAKIRVEPVSHAKGE